MAVGYNDFGQCDVSSWTGIIQIADGYYHSNGLKSDGTVLLAADYLCKVYDWNLEIIDNGDDRRGGSSGGECFIKAVRDN